MNSTAPQDTPAFQDQYPDRHSHCYGCGRLNEHGLHLKSRWDGEESVCRFTAPEHMHGVPGFAYGGLIASLMDCHGIGTATAAHFRALEQPIGSDPSVRYVTGALRVDYLRPTPTGRALELRGTVKEMKGRKIVVGLVLLVEGTITARGEVVAVRMPDDFAQRSPGGAVPDPGRE